MGLLSSCPRGLTLRQATLALSAQVPLLAGAANPQRSEAAVALLHAHPDRSRSQATQRFKGEEKPAPPLKGRAGVMQCRGRRYREGRTRKEPNWRLELIRELFFLSGEADTPWIQNAAHRGAQKRRRAGHRNTERASRWPRRRSLPCGAGDTSLILLQEDPTCPGQLGPQATTMEPRPWNPRTPTGDPSTVRSPQQQRRVAPLSTARDTTQAATKTQCSHK